MLRLAQTRIAEQRRTRKLIGNRERHEIGIRYCLRSETTEFAEHHEEGDDTALLERICAAYIKAVDEQRFVQPSYGATPWWRKQERQLAPVRHALATRNIKKLREMYRAFFQDACSTGLVPRLFSETASPLGRVMSRVRKCLVLSDALYRIGYWHVQTGERFPISDLEGPAIGSPFGIRIGGTLVAARAEYQHYCAQRILDLVSSRNAVVTEIGGGFGGMAYYLLRSCPTATYIDFDVPESLALTAYYLSKSMPQLSMLLYGEEELTQNAIARYDIILAPPWELKSLPEQSADVTFSSHALSDLVPGAQAEYLREIARITGDWFLYVGAEEACRSLRSSLTERYPSLAGVEHRLSEWNRFRALSAIEVEHLYRVQKQDTNESTERDLFGSDPVDAEYCHDSMRSVPHDLPD